MVTKVAIERDDISLLEEELAQLTVKSSSVVPKRNIWKTRKKFEIKVTGQNLFTIEFDDEEDLELILVGRHWLFRRNLVIFKKMNRLMERSSLRLVNSSFWLKAGPCLLECEKKDLTHAIGSTFGGIIRSELIGDFCHIKVELDVQKPLRRGIFILAGSQENLWVPFKYENLPGFCFGCGCMAHEIKECNDTPTNFKELPEDDLPFFLALKAKSN
ncbi:hypothetical protein Gotur_003464 [Gossypium turneri]